MAETTDELTNNSSTLTSGDRYPTDAMNSVSNAGVDDDMLDPLEETVVGVVVVPDTEYDTSTSEGISDTGAFAGDADTGDIDQTRAQIGQTIDAIQDKLRPQTLAEQAKSALSDVASHAKDTLADVTSSAVHNVVDEAKDAYHGVIDPVTETVGNAVESAKGATTSLYTLLRENPIPLAMAGVGIYWFYRNLRDRGTSGGGSYNPTIFTPQASGLNGAPAGGAPTASGSGPSLGERAGQAVDSVQHKASDMVDNAQKALSSVTDKAQSTLSAVGDKAQNTLSTVTDKAQQTVRTGADSLQRVQDETPLMVAGFAVLAGLMIGMMLPATPIENRLMGEARDRLVDTAGDKAQDVKQKVASVAQQAADAATNTAKQEAQNQGLVQPTTEGPAPSTPSPGNDGGVSA